jgi:elongation factor G
MATVKVSDIRNVAFCGHGSSGKTTLVDRMLFEAGVVKTAPSVDDGSSLMDFDEVEKAHKYSIEAHVAHLEHAGKWFNLVDTPGYPDFLGQTISAFDGVDNAAIVINAHSGIEVNTRRVFKEAGDDGLGRIIVIDKMDDESADFPKLYESIREIWGPQCVLLNVPLGQGHDFKGVASTLKVPDDTSGALLDPEEIHQPLMESIIEVDEEVMERYFEGQQPTDEELARLIVPAIKEGSLIPILCCAGKSGVGVKELLDAMGLCCLAPDQLERTAHDVDGKDIEIKPDPAAPLVATVFKTRIDPFVQKLSYVRVFSGTLKKDEQVHVSGLKKNVKIHQLLQVQGGQTENVDEAGPGQIVAVAKMEDLHTGAMLGDFVMDHAKLPTPMVGLAVTPKARGDEAKLSGALHKIEEEDPTIRLDRDPQTKELVMSGLSELHLQIVQEKLQRRDHVEVDTHEPKIAYRETIQAEAEGMYRHKKQSGGRGQFGEVHIRMYPLPRETDIDEFCSKDRFPQLKAKHYDDVNNFLWVDSVVGGVIPGNFMPAVEKGFKDRLVRGVIAGYQIQDVCVEVHFGKHHPVDSSEAAFKTAASMAFREVFQKAKPNLLEPIVKMAITVPEDSVGDVYSDMSTRRGRVLGSEAAGGGLQTIEAEAPLAEVSTYNRTLSSMTGGQGSYTMDFSHYDYTPSNVMQDIIAAAKVEEEEED